MSYGDILVSCPMPGQEHLAPERLDSFIQTEIGQRVLGQSVENIELLVQGGMKEEQAVSIALGAAVVRDESGNFMRDTAPETALAETHVLDSKKK